MAAETFVSELTFCPHIFLYPFNEHLFNQHLFSQHLFSQHPPNHHMESHQ